MAASQKSRGRRAGKKGVKTLSARLPQRMIREHTKEQIKNLRRKEAVHQQEEEFKSAQISELERQVGSLQLQLTNTDIFSKYLPTAGAHNPAPSCGTSGQISMKPDGFPVVSYPWVESASRDPFRADQRANFQLGVGPQPMAAQVSPSFDSAVCLSDENENAPDDEERSVSGDTIRMPTPEIEAAFRNARLGRSVWE